MSEIVLIQSLTAELQRKSEEVKELTGICDELITSASANYWPQSFFDLSNGYTMTFALLKNKSTF